MNGKPQIEIWGIAAGWGSTKSAAPGAFTVRVYQSSHEADQAVRNREWREVLLRNKIKA